MNYNAIRRSTPEVFIGKLSIGGKNPIAVQSMTNTDTHDVEATIDQIKALASAVITNILNSILVFYAHWFFTKNMHPCIYGIF